MGWLMILLLTAALAGVIASIRRGLANNLNRI
jgi:hypothetical protein